MTSTRSIFIWQSIPFLSYIQFPWRFLAVSIVFLSLLSVLPLSFLKESKFKSTISATLILIFICWYSPIFTPESYIKDSDNQYYSNPERISQEMSYTLPDYIPNIDYQALPLFTQRVSIVDQNKNEVPYTIIDNRTHSLIVETNPQDLIDITFNIFDFPGWTIKANNQLLEKSSNKEFPVIKVTINPDDYSDSKLIISAKLNRTPIRALADSLTLVTILVIASYTINQKFLTKSKP